MSERKERAEAGPPEIVVVDWISARRSGGHDRDYLAALTSALAAFRPRLSAPFLAPEGARPPTARLALYRAFLAEAWRLSAGAPPTVLVLANAGLMEIIGLALAVGARRGRKRCVAVMMLRREPDNYARGRSWVNGLLVRLLRRLVRQGRLLPVFDSVVVRDDWATALGRGGPLIEIPERRAGPGRARSMSEPLVFGLFGLLRAEKGMVHYDRVIRLARDRVRNARIRVQLSCGDDPDAGAHALALRRAWSAAGRVEFLDGHLPAGSFDALLESLDVLVLPYDVASYGGGTSGLMHEAIQLGKVVLATRFAWAVENYHALSTVVWLESLREAELACGLDEAARRALAARSGKIEAPRRPSSFANDWVAAVDAAVGLLSGAVRR